MQHIKNRGETLRVPILLSIIFLVAASVVFGQGEPPVLLSEPDFTQGTHNSICWVLSDDTVPIVYEIEYARDEEFTIDVETIPGIDTASASGNCVDVGTISFGSSLAHGVEYFYRIRYRYDSTEGRVWSEWSNVVSSTQDNQAPALTIEELDSWTNTEEVRINFSVSDPTCGCVTAVRLYYRDPDSTRWILANETAITECSYDVIDHWIGFNSADFSGDAEYQFFLTGVDSLGNSTIPGPRREMTWTRFDTEPPTSEIDGSTIPTYVTRDFVNLVFTGEDSYSGVFKVHLMRDGDTDTLSTIYEYGASVSDTFVYNFGGADGHYRLRTEAVDSAMNHETHAGWDVEFFVDRTAPILEDLGCRDMTDDPTRYDVAADPVYDWTNNRTIYLIPDCEDPEIGTDLYASGFDSVMIAEDVDFTVGLSVQEYATDGTFEYDITSAGDGMKNIFMRVKDIAGNWSEVVEDSIMLDEEVPAITEVRIADATFPDSSTEITDERTVVVNITPDETSGEYYKMFLTHDEDELDAIDDDSWIDYRARHSYTFPGTSEEMEIFVVLKDSAGNVSEAGTDDIMWDDRENFFVNITSLRDFDGPDMTGEYTNTVRVLVNLTFGEHVTQIVLRDDSGDSTIYNVSTGGAATADTTILHEFAPGDGVRDICAYGLNPVVTVEHTSPESCSDIILDTRNPEMDGITLVDMGPGPGDSEAALENHTNSRQIRVYFDDAEDDRSGLYYVRLTCGEEILEAEYESPILFNLPSFDASPTVDAQIQDAAGNWSRVHAKLITLDTHAPTYRSFTLMDASTGDEMYTDSIEVRVRIDADDNYDTIERHPAYVAFFHERSIYPSGLSDLWREIPESMEMLTYLDSDTPGDQYLYSAIKDSAGNISEIRADSIIFNVDIILDIELYDIDSDSEEYTNDFRTGVNLNITGTPPAYYFLYDPTVPETYEDTVWIEFPADGHTTFTFTSGEGERQICGIVKSVSEIISEPNCETIILDLTPPDLTPGGFVIWDKTETDIIPTQFKAHMGWSNELDVWASLPEVEDELSNVISVGFFGEHIQTEAWLTGYDDEPFGDEGIVFPYNYDTRLPISFSPDYEGMQLIRGRAIDGAGNWNNADDYSEIVIEGGYDITAPTLTILDPLTLEASDTIEAQILPQFPCNIIDGPLDGYIWKVCFWFDGDVDEAVCVEYNSTWDVADDNIYMVEFPFQDVLEFNRYYEMSAVSVDMAGNPSPVTTVTLWTIPDTIVPNFVLTDPTDTDDTMFTNQQTVRTFIDIPGEPDSMKFSEEPNLLGASWEPFSPEGSFTFSNSVNELKTVYCQVMHSGIVKKDTAQIILDTRNPSLDEIAASDISSGDPNWSDERLVRIDIYGASDYAPGEVAALMVAEDDLFTVNVQIIEFDLTDPYVEYEVQEEPYIMDDYIEAGREDQRVIFAKVLDRAENASGEDYYGIVVDFDEEEVTNHPNPFNPTLENTYIRIKAEKTQATAEISIYDMFGSLVNTMSATADAGSRSMEITWDGKNGNGDEVASGVYVCVVEIGDDVYKRKIAVWKGDE